MQEWPLGAMVWHRACGKRGVIGGYSVMSGELLIEVCFGANSRWEKCAVLELSSTKVSDGTAGDEWKENAGV